MKVYSFGDEKAPAVMLLPGTCCHWKSNFGHVIPPLAVDYRVLCVSYDDVPSDDDFVAALETRERYAAVVSAIKRMNEKYSTVMYYRYCREMSIAEIAALTGISEKAVYTRIARGKRILLKTLAKEGAI